MRSLLSETPGGPETLVLRNIPAPQPCPGQVRIRVAACGINYPDVLIIEDRYQFKPPRPFAPGGEVAGTIDALGEGVTGLVLGQRVPEGEAGQDGFEVGGQALTPPARGCRSPPG